MCDRRGLMPVDQLLVRPLAQFPLKPLDKKRGEIVDTKKEEQKEDKKKKSRLVLVPQTNAGPVLLVLSPVGTKGGRIHQGGQNIRTQKEWSCHLTNYSPLNSLAKKGEKFGRGLIIVAGQLLPQL